MGLLWLRRVIATLACVAEKRFGGGGLFKLRKTKATEVIGWIAYLDIYGFRGHLESAFFPETESKLLEMHRALSDDSIFSANSNYFMFSDSLVFWDAAESIDILKLKNFVDRVAHAQSVAARFDFLFRGSLAHGRILLSPTYILGDAYLRAYTYEAKNLLNPTVVIPVSELDSAIIAQFTERIENLQLKTGAVEKVVPLQYVAWDEIRRIKQANIAAIMSGTSQNKADLRRRWESIREE